MYKQPHGFYWECRYLVLQSCQSSEPQYSAWAIRCDWSDQVLVSNSWTEKSQSLGQNRLGNRHDDLAPEQLGEAKEDAPHPLLSIKGCHVEGSARQLNKYDLPKANNRHLIAIQSATSNNAKQSKLVFHHQTVNLNWWIRWRLLRLFLILYLTW